MSSSERWLKLAVKTSPQFDGVAKHDDMVHRSTSCVRPHTARTQLSKATNVNFSDTSSLKFLKTKGSIGHAFTVCIHTENQNQRSFYPFVLHEISVLIELLLGHLCYRLTDVPPQPNSPNITVPATPPEVFTPRAFTPADFVITALVQPAPLRAV